MSRSGKDYEVGRGRPPKATQWEKGKSANPGGRSARRPTGLLEIIDKLLLTHVKITIDGVSKRVSTLEAILEQLWNNGIKGDRRAMALFLRNHELVPQEAGGTVQIVFPDTDYNRDFSAYGIGGSSDEQIRPR
jgi:Family of unknown function (DUF5681)